MNKLSFSKLAFPLAVGASALFVTAATAAPLSRGVATSPDNGIETIRRVCDEDGRCWRERGERRVIIREESYAPRERYIERRGYRDRGYDDGGGIGFRAPGVSVGIGTDRY